MAKKISLFSRILIVCLCILTLSSFFVFSSSANDYIYDEDAYDDYQVSSVGVRAISFIDSSSGLSFDVECPGIYREGNALAEVDSVVDPKDIDTAYLYAFRENITRIYGHYNNNTKLEYDLGLLSAYTTAWDTLEVYGTQFYAHELDTAYNAPYAGHFGGLISLTSAPELFVGNATYTVTVQLWQKIVYTSDFVKGEWYGIRYFTRDLVFMKSVDGSMSLAPLFSDFVASNALNSIQYVHNGIVRETRYISDGSDAYVNVLNYKTRLELNDSVPTIRTRFHYEDVMCPAATLDALNGLSAVNDGLAPGDVQIQVGTFLKDSLAAFLEFELFPDFTLSHLFWTIFGFIVVTALIFVFRK